MNIGAVNLFSNPAVYQKNAETTGSLAMKKQAETTGALAFNNHTPMGGAETTGSLASSSGSCGSSFSAIA